jgi:hypothetical protein
VLLLLLLFVEEQVDDVVDDVGDVGEDREDVDPDAGGCTFRGQVLADETTDAVVWVAPPPPPPLLPVPFNGRGIVSFSSVWFLILLKFKVCLWFLLLVLCVLFLW